MKIIIYIFIALSWIETICYIIMIDKERLSKFYTKKDAVISFIVCTVYTILLLEILNHLK
jgi:hypothetical protein